MTKDSNQTAEIFSMIKIGEFRPFKQFVELYKADLEAKYVSGYTPLMEAVFLQNDIFVNYIADHVRKISGNNQARYSNYINAKSSDGKTALIIATLGNSDTKIIQILLEKGANPTLVDLHGKSVKDYAPYAVCQEVEDFWLYYKPKNKFGI
jgi:ankyrin repeat protein